MSNHPRPRTTDRYAARCGVTLAAAIVLLTGCGGDGDDRDDDTDTSSSSATTQPPADDDAAFVIVEDLVVEANALIDELLQSPTAVDHPDNPEIDRLREIHTEDSPTPDGVVAQLEELNDSGQRERPSASGVFSDFGVYEMTVVDEDTIRFRTCSTEDSETVDANGEVVDQRAQVTQGVGEARREEGIWRIYGISPDDDRTLPIDPGSAIPGFCDDLYAGQDTP